MKIKISGNRKVADIQHEFNAFFPFLNLEFFDLSDDQTDKYLSSGKKFPQFLVNDIREEQKDGELLVTKHMTVMELENLLSDEFGLKAQVFVKAADKWVRSSHNGYWSLYYKNEAGKSIEFQYRSNF